MTPIIDIAKEWLLSLTAKTKSPEPILREYNGKQVWVHSQTKDYAIVSDTEVAEKMYSVELKELK